MRVVPVKRFRVNGTLIDAAIMEINDPKPEKITIIPRRELVKLQRLFRFLERGEIPEYKELKHTVKKALDKL